MENVSTKINNHILKLRSDGRTNPESAIYPITWKGWFWSFQIEVVQYSMDSQNFDHFEFKVYPRELNRLKKKVWQAINNHLQPTA